MSKNCLLSKLKGTVDNNDLDRYGYITFKNFRRVYADGNPGGFIKINSLDERVFYSDSASTTSIGTTATLADNIYAPEGFGDAYITKYNSVNINLINTYNAEVKLEDLAFLNPLSINGLNIKGDLSSLRNMNRISGIKIEGNSNKITGNIAELVPMLYRHYKANSTEYINVYSPLIEGDFNDVVSALSGETYEYGESNYTWYTIMGNNNKVTCNGALVNGRRVNITYSASTGNIVAYIVN